MPSLSRAILLSVAVLVLAAEFACNSSTAPSSSGEILAPPPRSLSAREIMRTEAIFSIQFVRYDSVVVNGHPDSSFRASDSFVIDTLRFKLDEYYADQTPGFNITVYNLKTSTAWNLYSGKVTDPHVPNLLVAYEQMVQYTLGSSLKNPYRLVAQEFVGGVRCNVFEDSTGYKEWVWIEHPIPIQRFSPGTLRRDGIFQISTVQLRDLVINVSLPDSIFMPPERLALPNKRL